MRNIDEKVKLQQDLEYRIIHDTLTDVYNRTFFEQKFEELNNKENAPVAIIICDLDELKYVNDNFGHKEGDALIKAAARLLNKFSSDTIIVARIGGDEFVIIVVDTKEIETENLVQRILNEFEKENEKGLERVIKLSIGFAFTHSSIGNMNELFSQADKNMYKDKLKKKQISNIFMPR